jgi:hypothetical protein
MRDDLLRHLERFGRDVGRTAHNVILRLRND